MGYRIRYEQRRHRWAWWFTGGLVIGTVLWSAAVVGPAWQDAAAGRGLDEVLARFVGEMIHGAH